MSEKPMSGKTRRFALALAAIMLILTLCACDAQPSIQAAAGESIACRVSVDCHAAIEQGYDAARLSSDNGVVVEEKTIVMRGGDTVFDALRKAAQDHGVALSHTGSGSMLYVVSIGGLQEGDCGAGSGWMYCVNGEFVSRSAGGQPVYDGDVIQWRYTCNQGKDIGAAP